MDKELLVKVWIIFELLSFTILCVISLPFISNIPLPFDYFWLGILFLPLLILLATVSFLGIFISITGFGDRIKFSKNLLVASSIIFTFILLGAIWLFIPWHTEELPRKTIQIVDYSCADGQAQIKLRNAGIESMSLGVCNKPNSITGSDSFNCGDLRIVKLAGGKFNNGEVDAASLMPGQFTNYTEDCGTGMYCSYRFLIASAVSPVVNVATVTC